MSDRSEPISTETRHLAEGEAAFVLLESLLLTLLDKGLLSSEEVVDAVENVIAVKHEMEGTEPKLSKVAAGLLTTLANSVSAARPGSDRR